MNHELFNCKSFLLHDETEPLQNEKNRKNGEIVVSNRL